MSGDGAPLQRKIALFFWLRLLSILLILPVGFVAFWAGIKHAAKVPVMDGGTLLLLCLTLPALWLLSEYFGHLKGKYTRQLFERRGW